MVRDPYVYIYVVLLVSSTALSAVARMIKVIPTFVPLAQVLPIMLSGLPLRADPLEGVPVYGTLIHLVQNLVFIFTNQNPSFHHYLNYKNTYSSYYYIFKTFIEVIVLLKYFSHIRLLYNFF